MGFGGSLAPKAWVGPAGPAGAFAATACACAVSCGIVLKSFGVANEVLQQWKSRDLFVLAVEKALAQVCRKGSLRC